MWTKEYSVMNPILAAILIILAVGLATIGVNAFMRRKGYSIPGRTVVRCSKGHFFRTIWIEGGSFKAIRLAPRTRIQYCPVGKHLSIVDPVKEQDLTAENRRNLGE